MLCGVAEAAPVAVVNLAGPDAVARTQEVRAYLAGRGAARSYEPPLSEVLEGRSRPYALDLTAARDAYAAFEYARAQKLLATELDEALQQAADEVLRAVVHEILLERGVVAVAAKDAGSARQFFVGVLNLDPSFKLDEARYNPRVRRVFAQAKRLSGGRRSGRLAISATPAEARGEVDGRAVAASDTIALAPGLHLMVVRLPGYRRQASLVLIRSGQTAKLQPTLAPEPKIDSVARALRAAAKAPAGEQRLAQLPTLTALIGVDHVLAVEREEARTLAVRLYETKGERKCSEPLPLGDPDALQHVGRLLGIVPLAVSMPGAEPRADLLQTRPARSPSPWYTKWWVWTAVGVAVATTVTLSVVLTTGERDAELVCCP